VTLLREREVLEITKLSRMTIWRMERDGQFPRRLKIGRGSRGAVAWPESEVSAWIKERAAQRNGA
jgi:prophage regulatory protein